MKFTPANLDWEVAYALQNALIVPRPIALVSTVGEDGVFNIAPFSYFCPVAVRPMLLGFNTGWKRDGQKKDTLVNIECSGEFVINVVDEDLAEAMNRTSKAFPGDVDEFKEAGLTSVKADLVKPPRVGESPINMECRTVQILVFGDAPRRSSFIIGEVIRVHVREALLVGDEIQMPELKAIARMSGDLYCRTRDIFEMKRPE